MLAPTRDVTLRGRLRTFALWQLPTMVLAFAVWLALALTPGTPDPAAGPSLGLLLVLGAGAAAISVDWARIGFGWRILVPAADLAGLSVLNYHAQGALPSVALLATIPVVWLGFQFGSRGVAIAIVGVLGVAMAPLDGDAAALQEAITLLNVVLTICIGVGVGVVAAVMGRILTETQGRLVQEARRLRTELNTLNGIMLTVDAAIVISIDGEPPRLNAEARRVADLAGTGSGGVDDFLNWQHIYERDGLTPVPTERRPFTRAVAGESFRDVMCYIGPPGGQIALVSSCHQIIADDDSRAGSVLVGFDATTFVDAVRVREEFLTTVSHELRTPLTSITASLEMLHGEIDDVRRGTTGPDVAERLLAIASRNAGTLLSRINQLLSAAPGAVEELSPRPTDVGRLIRDAITKHRAHAADRGVVLEVLAPSGVIVDLDPIAYERVIDNLVSNAIKYTQSGGRATIVMSHLDGQLHLCVTDTGMGMSIDEQRQVFDRFYRSSSVVDAAVPGIGIGLTVTKRLVRLLGGHITVTSERGYGTTMEVVIPAGDDRLELGTP